MSGLRTGVVGELASAQSLRDALGRLRERGYTRLDAFTPYAVEGVDELCGHARSPVPLITLLGGLLGAAGGFGLQWYCNAYDSPLNVGGRPLFSWPAWIIITFEAAILSGASAAFVSCLALSRLGRLWDPVFEVDDFESATLDRFWVAIDADDPRFETRRAARDLGDVGATRIAIVDATGATMVTTGGDVTIKEAAP